MLLQLAIFDPADPVTLVFHLHTACADGIKWHFHDMVSLNVRLRCSCVGRRAFERLSISRGNDAAFLLFV